VSDILGTKKGCQWAVSPVVIHGAFRGPFFKTMLAAIEAKMAERSK
jgi:hypothetical protein